MDNCYISGAVSGILLYIPLNLMLLYITFLNEVKDRLSDAMTDAYVDTPIDKALLLDKHTFHNLTNKDVMKVQLRSEMEESAHINEMDEIERVQGWIESKDGITSHNKEIERRFLIIIILTGVCSVISVMLLFLSGCSWTIVPTLVSTLTSVAIISLIQTIFVRHVIKYYTVSEKYDRAIIVLDSVSKTFDERTK